MLTGALTGGAVASLALFAIVFGVGRLASFKALGLIEALVPTARSSVDRPWEPSSRCWP